MDLPLLEACLNFVIRKLDESVVDRTIKHKSHCSQKAWLDRMVVPVMRRVDRPLSVAPHYELLHQEVAYIRNSENQQKPEVLWIELDSRPTEIYQNYQRWYCVSQG